MKLVVIGIDALSFEIISRQPFPAINGFDKHVMRSTIPYITPPAWTSMWTGKNPSVHGILGVQSLRDYKNYGNKDRPVYLRDMKTLRNWRIWDYLADRGLNCVVRDIPVCLPLFRGSKADVGATWQTTYSEAFFRGWNIKALPEDKRGEKLEIGGERAAELGKKRKQKITKENILTVALKHEKYAEFLEQKDDIDVLFLGYHEVDPACHMHGIGHKIVGDLLAMISETVDMFADFPTIIVSDHGMETYPKRLNLENFLRTRDFFFYNDKKRPIFKKSKAYPVDCGDHRVTTQDFGVYLNTEDKAEGFLTYEQGQNVAGSIIRQLNNIDNVQAIPKSQYYDLNGKYYEYAPDILVYSENHRMFIQSPYDNFQVVQPFGRNCHSLDAVFALNFTPKGGAVDNIEHVYDFICRQVGVPTEYMEGPVDLPEVPDDPNEEAEVLQRLKDLGYIEEKPR